jgi:hypothetical protein
MRMTLASPVVWVFAIFLCTYTGVCHACIVQYGRLTLPCRAKQQPEDGVSRLHIDRNTYTHSTLVVSFLLKERNADPDTVGYVASGRPLFSVVCMVGYIIGLIAGFWGGLAVGRLLLGQMSP